MDEFEEDGETWVAAFRLDDSSRMMGGTSRPRDVSVKAAYTPGGMLPAIGSTQPVGGSVTRTIGARAGVKLKAEQLRALLALIVLAVCARLVIDLVVAPETPYIVEALS